MKVALIAASVLLATTGLASAKAPKFAVGGTWHCVQFCMPFFTGAPTHIKQSGASLMLMNETGAVSRGLHLGGRTIRVFEWLEYAKVSPSMRMIKFENGAVWTR